MRCHFCGDIFNSSFGARLHLTFHLSTLRRANLRLPVGWRPARSEPQVIGHLSVPMDAQHMVGVLRERAEERGMAAAMMARANDRWRFLDISEKTYRHAASPTVADISDDLLPIVERWLNADRTDTLLLLLTRPPVTVPVTTA